MSTQLRRTQGLNTESLTVPETVADPRQSLDSEQISPATIAHHTVYEKTRNLQPHHICQWEAQPYLVGPLSRLVGKPFFEPSLTKNVLPLKTAAYGPNNAISLTQTFKRILFFSCNGRDFGVQKAENGDRGRIVFTATLTNKIQTNMSFFSTNPNKRLFVRSRSNTLDYYYRVFWAKLAPPYHVLNLSVQVHRVRRSTGRYASTHLDQSRKDMWRGVITSDY